MTHTILSRYSVVENETTNRNQMIKTLTVICQRTMVNIRQKIRCLVSLKIADTKCRKYL